jgi:hypothetical protein
MIAYLFFHHLADGEDAVEYEAGLRHFHVALRDAGIPGFDSSRTYRLEDGYCDWYVVANSAALDPLNDAAVTGSRSELHDVVARRAVNFTGKLLKLAAGRYDPDSLVEIRFSKPKGMSYEDLYARLEPWTSRSDTSLWRRMLVLGPPPEFSLLARAPEALPRAMDPVERRLDPV